MCVLEKYQAALDARAAEEKALAAQARERGDEREHALRLMQASMCGDMLKALGRAQHENPQSGALQRMLDGAVREQARMREKDDADSADRARIKAETIQWAMNILKELEKEHAE